MNKEFNMSNHRVTRFIASGAIDLAGIASIAVVPVAAASAAGNSVVVNAKCSGTSMSNLQIQREDTGKLSVDFGVDMARHVAQVPWKVTETQNGTTFVSTVQKTIADGSFSITRVLNPMAGTNTIAATAVNTKTGESCAISGSLWPSPQQFPKEWHSRPQAGCARGALGPKPLGARWSGIP